MTLDELIVRIRVAADGSSEDHDEHRGGMGCFERDGQLGLQKDYRGNPEWN